MKKEKTNRMTIIESLITGILFFYSFFWGEMSEEARRTGPPACMELVMRDDDDGETFK